jgi:uncharacterized protein YndB with AHSA1/START domain
MADIVHSFSVGTSPASAYHALVDRNGLSGWWVEDVKIEPKVDSIAEFAFPNITLKMRIARLDPDRRVVWEPVDSIPDWDGTVIEWEIQPSGRGADVVFGHRRWKTAGPLFVRFNTAWAWHLMSFIDFLETGSGRPGVYPH